MEIVCACIIQNQQVFIAKRNTTYSGIWEFPGGKVEKGESEEEAIIREIKEELNLEIEVKKKLITIQDHTKNTPLNVHAYACHILSGELILTAHSEGYFVDPSQIDLSQFHSSDQPIVEACIDYLKNGKVCEIM